MKSDERTSKESQDHKRDISSLYARLGLDAGTYREFQPEAPQVRVSEPTSVTTVSVATVEEPRMHLLASLDTPTPASKNHVTSAAVATSLGSTLPTARPKRWTALRNLESPISSLHPQGKRPSVKVAFFSMCGGVGRTTLSVNMARALSAHHRDVLLVNCGSNFALEPYLRPRTPRFDVISFLHGVPGGHLAPSTVIHASAADLIAGPNASQPALFFEHAAESSDFVLFDLPVALDAPARELLSTVDHVIVPLLPDLASAASVSVLESTLGTRGKPSPQISFLLNRFDESRSLHREVRTRLEHIVGPRLLRTTVREDAGFQDAAAEGFAYVDQSPLSAAAADLHSVADWIGSLSLDPMAANLEVARRGTA